MKNRLLKFPTDLSLCLRYISASVIAFSAMTAFCAPSRAASSTPAAPATSVLPANLSAPVAPAAPMPQLTTLAPTPADFNLAVLAVSQKRYADAVSILQKLSQDNKYKNTPYAAAAIYRIGQIDRDLLNNYTGAAQQFQTLINQYSGTIYPGSATIEQDLRDLRIEAALAGVAPVGPSQVPVEFGQAANAIAQKNYTGALSALKDIYNISFLDRIGFSKNTKALEYEHTSYVPMAIYFTAQIDRDILNDDSDAMQQFQTLHNQYSSVVFPGSKSIAQEELDLGNRIDRQNSGKPLYKLIDGCVALTGRKSYSYWIALFIIAILVRVVITPLTIKQYKSMAEMQRLQPHIKNLNDKYAKDPQVKSQKMMELYKEHGVNPMAGCFPMLLQMPIYWFMYQAILLYRYHFGNGVFLWISSGPAHWAATIAPGVIGSTLAEPDIPLLLLYSISMYVTSRMTPATDPTQAETQKTMALMTSVMFFVMFINWHFPSAFVLYWLVSNIFGTVAQIYFMKQNNVAAAALGSGIPLPKQSAALADTGSDATSNASRKLSTAKPTGASRGVIAPKTYPKKKRR